MFLLVPLLKKPLVIETSSVVDPYDDISSYQTALLAKKKKLFLSEKDKTNTWRRENSLWPLSTHNNTFKLHNVHYCGKYTKFHVFKIHR